MTDCAAYFELVDPHLPVCWSDTGDAIVYRAAHPGIGLTLCMRRGDRALHRRICIDQGAAGL